MMRLESRIRIINTVAGVLETTAFATVGYFGYTGYLGYPEMYWAAYTTLFFAVGGELWRRMLIAEERDEEENRRDLERGRCMNDEVYPLGMHSFGEEIANRGLRNTSGGESRFNLN